MEGCLPFWPGEQAFREAADLLPTIVWCTDTAGRLAWCNEQMRNLTGRSVAELVEHERGALLHPDDCGKVLARWDRAIDTGTSVALDARLPTADGGWRWHVLRAAPRRDADDAIAAWIVSAADIEASVAAVETLTRDNEELEQELFSKLDEINRNRLRLQTIFNACPDFLYLLRLSKDGLVFEDLNPAAEALFEGGRDGVVGQPASIVKGVESTASIEHHVRQTLETGKSTYEVESRQPNLPRLVLQVVGAPLAYSNTEEGLVLFCARDVTEQRSIEDALRQSQKMEAVGQLTGGLAHDFNNLLTGIAGSLDLLKLRVAQGRYSAVDRYLNAAQDAATRAASLTHRLLAFSRRQTLDPKRIDANRLVGGMQELLQRTVGPEIEIAVTLAPTLWTVLVDPSQLENALLNLCINARDAMPGGGRIVITTANETVAEHGGGAGKLPAGDYVTVSVSDNGSGIAPEILSRIFDPFFTTKPLGSGTGLGLSMIYGFAQQSGGQVQVRSTVGVGTTMRVLLPRDDGPASAPRDTHDLSHAPRSAEGEVVLIVDDEDTVRMLVAELLRDLGYSTVLAGDAQSGLRVLETDQRVDLLVTDVGMPGGMNGRQLAEAGRALRPTLKVLFITGYAENTVLNQDHFAPGIEVLTKPFAMETLATRIRTLIHETEI